jgi:hypothetical protein
VQQLLVHATFVLGFIEEVSKDTDRDEAVTRAMVGLALVHFSAQPDPFLTQNTPSTPPDTP